MSVLPFELLVNIVTFISYQDDAHSLRLTCHKLRDAVESTKDLTLQYDGIRTMANMLRLFPGNTLRRDAPSPPKLPALAAKNVVGLELRFVQPALPAAINQCMMLQTLVLEDVRHVDLHQLVGCVSLQVLVVTTGSGALDAAPLAECRSLEVLELAAPALNGLAALAQCTKLRVLDIAGCGHVEGAPGAHASLHTITINNHICAPWMDWHGLPQVERLELWVVETEYSHVHDEYIAFLDINLSPLNTLRDIVIINDSVGDALLDVSAFTPPNNQVLLELRNIGLRGEEHLLLEEHLLRLPNVKVAISVSK